MMGSAQISFSVEEEAAEMAEVARASELRQQVAERVALHRQKRVRPASDGLAVAPARKPAGAKERIAAAVAERYAHTPSYRTFLAQEARRATEQAAAAAEVARRNAEAVAAEQQRLLNELELWDAPQDFNPATATVVAEAASVVEPIAIPAAGLTVRLYEDLGPAATVPQRSGATRNSTEPNAAEAMALDAEIAFRQAPVFEEYHVEPTVPLPANLLEFPRQLIASRKARPLLAEGPLLDEAKTRSKQLRIFEVESELISPAPPPVTNAPEWSSIRLDAHTVTPLVETSAAMPVLASLLPPQTAPLSLRMMAASVDLLLVAGGLLAAVAVFARVAPAVPAGMPAAIAAGASLLVFYLIYQALFFTLSDQTPGMRYACIGLCTFSDENPTRSAMRKRILAQTIAVCPLGLGLLWAFLDEDGLGWHDRISRMYQRAY